MPDAAAEERCVSPEPPELAEVTEEELTTPSRECTVTDDPPGRLLDPETLPVPAVTLDDGTQSAPMQVLALARRLSFALEPALTCAPEPLAAAAEEESPAAVAQGSLFRCST